MKVVLNKEAAVHSVEITGGFTGFTGSYINLEISAKEAYELLMALDVQRTMLRDMALNYYDCPECGNTHSNTIKVCPEVSHE